MVRAGGFRRGVAWSLIVSLLAAGCRAPGGVVRFAEPEGAVVTIDGGAPHRIPFEALLSRGGHPIEFAAGPPDSPSLSSGEDSVRG